MADTSDGESTEDRFLQELRWHLAGWHDKIRGDFTKDSYETELAALHGDGIYRMFAFDNPTYVLIRLMGRMSISIGRRLGQIYDTIPRSVVQARFGLESEEVAPMVRGELKLDIGIPYGSPNLSEEDTGHIVRCVQEHLGVDTTGQEGLGIEIRYNFNPNDSARLRKDDDMARYLSEDGMLPIYIIFSSISPRDEAIARLKRSGWLFVIGEDAVAFMRELTGMDIETIMEAPVVKAEIAREVGVMMSDILDSYAFSEAVKEVYDRK